MQNIVYFDLESRHSAREVGGWSQEGMRKMGISVAVTYSTKSGNYTLYTQEQTNELVDELQQADLVVGYNHLHFDYEVIKGQLGLMCDFDSMTRDLDLCKDIEHRLGRRLKLDAIAQATLGLGKTSEGMQALVWWAEYQKTKDPERFVDIARYCCFDVKVTRFVHEFGCQNGYINYTDNNGILQQLAVDW